jgi:hypothetical protein
MTHALMLTTFLTLAVIGVAAQSPTVTHVDRDKVAAVLAGGGSLVTSPDYSVSGIRHTGRRRSTT